MTETVAAITMTQWNLMLDGGIVFRRTKTQTRFVGIKVHDDECDAESQKYYTNISYILAFNMNYTEFFYKGLH